MAKIKNSSEWFYPGVRKVFFMQGQNRKVKKTMIQTQNYLICGKYQLMYD